MTAPPRLRPRLLIALLALLTSLAPAAAEQSDVVDVDELQKQATAAFARSDYSAARAALERVAVAKPDNPAVLYNLACALAQLGELDAAADRLTGAISFGFVDFLHMQRDDHLDPLRNHAAYKNIVLAWRELLDARGDANLESARRVFTGKYRFEKDIPLRLVYAAAFDEQSFAEARRDIQSVADWAFASLFTDLGPDDGADPTPDPWVSVILPTPEDFVGMVRMSNVGGFYSHDQLRLISQDLGPSLRHEFLHVLHWRDMTRRAQQHPDWIMEGLGCLMEDVETADSGELVPTPSWRTNIAKRIERAGRLRPLREFVSMPREHFVGQRPSAHYAQARALMLHLHAEGRLLDFYRAYVESFDKDPTGAAALERAFDAPLAQIERDHRKWLRELPEVAERIRPGMASLGVVISPGRGDGPEVQEVVARTGAGRAGLRPRDVITALDGRATRTMEDLVRILSDYEPGDRVEVAIRRGTLRLTVEVALTPAD